MSLRERARLLCDRIAAGPMTLCEVFAKEGRSRRSELGSQGPATVMTVEAGWAVRGGAEGGSVFVTGTGMPPPRLDLPAVGGEPLHLPVPGGDATAQSEGGDEAPLIVEREARALLEAIEVELGNQLPGARLLRAVLDDGASASRIVSSRGIDIGFRHRLTLLHVEAYLPGGSEVRTSLEVVEREAQRLQPRAIARRLADSLSVRQGDAAPARDRGEMVLAPPVSGRLVSALAPLWTGAAGAQLARALTDRDDRLASPLVTVIDDGRLPGGPLSAPWDGEGMPTRRVRLVARGRFVQPLVDWREAAPPRWRATGCVRRPGWRDRPAVGASHLFVEPDSNVAAHELVSSVTRGFYLLDVLGPVRVDLAGDRFAVPVDGFSLDRGVARQAVAAAWLCGSVRALLKGVRGVARDLSFVLDGGLVGSPSLLVGGLELRREL